MTDGEPSTVTDIGSAEQREHPAPSGFGAPVSLREDGLLWYINKHLFHPLGYALGFSEQVSATDATPTRPQFTLFYPDGGNPITFENDDDRDGNPIPPKVEAAFARARETLYQFSDWPFRDVPDDGSADETGTGTPG